MIKYDCGEPAFENVDDLLAEKIVTHSRNHSDKLKKQPLVTDEKPQAAGKKPPEETTSPPWYRLLIPLLFFITLFFILYHFFNRKPAR